LAGGQGVGLSPLAAVTHVVAFFAIDPCWQVVQYDIYTLYKDFNEG